MNIVHLLQNGELDVILFALPYPAENIDTHHLFYDPFLLTYPPGHPIGSVKPLRTRDLKGKDILLLEDGHCLRDHALAACKLNDAQITVPYQATSLHTIVQMVANGIGLTLLPKMAVDSGILSGTTLRTKQFNEKQVWRSIGIGWRKNNPRIKEYELLSDYIKSSGK